MPMSLNVIQPRTCGDCVQCCIGLRIKEIGKPERTPCRFQVRPDGGGCSVYDKRPHPCQIYECVWLQGSYGNIPFGDELKPDVVGVVFSNFQQGVTKHQTLTATEVRPGGLDHPAVREVLARVTQRLVVILIHHDGRRQFVGPDYKIRTVLARMHKESGKAGRQSEVNYGDASYQGKL